MKLNAFYGLFFSIFTFFIDSLPAQMPFYRDYQNNVELPFVVVICSMNNIRWVEQNLDSIFMQKYHNFRVIYVDDASQDGTADAVQGYIEKYNLHDRLLLLRNEKRCRKLKNEYRAFHMCNDHEIIVQLDGDDWYKHNMVLSNLNKEYLKGTVWLTYGSHENFPPSDMGSKSAATPQDILAERTFRKKSFIYMPTRSFFAWLVKQIKLEDFINDDIPGYEGKFYPVCDDVLIMWAMLEMAHYRFSYLTDISYVANRANPLISLHVDGDLLKQAARSLRKTIPLYPVIECPIIGKLETCEKARADLVICSENPWRLEALLPTIQSSLKYIDTILVIFEPKTDEFQRVYNNVINKYSDIKFININDLVNKNGQDSFCNLRNAYVMLLKDSYVPVACINCRVAIKWLEQTYAHAFYFNLQENTFLQKNIPYQHIINNIHAWKFSCDKEHGISVHQCSGVLYRKSNVINLLEQSYGNLKQFYKVWHSTEYDPKKVGLFYTFKKIGSIT